MSIEPSSELPPLGQSLSAPSGLGSLAQAARAKQIKQARNLMFVVGAFMLVIYGAQFMNVRNEAAQVVQKEIQAVRAKGMAEAPAAVEKERHRITLFCQIFYGSAVVLGVVFLLLGVFAQAYPVPATVLALVLYIGRSAIFGYINHEYLLRGGIFQIIVIVALLKSVQAAIAYQKNKV